MLGIRIKLLREARNLTQVQLAEALHVSKQSICNWENENILPSIEMLIKLAEVFSVSTDYLLGLDARQTLDVSNLPPAVVAHLRMLIEDILKSGKPSSPA